MIVVAVIVDVLLPRRLALRERRLKRGRRVLLSIEEDRFYQFGRRCSAGPTEGAARPLAEGVEPGICNGRVVARPWAGEGVMRASR